MGIPVDEARRLIKQANEMNPSFDTFREHIWSEFRQTGVGHTFFGRRLVYPEMTLRRKKVRQEIAGGKIVVQPGDVYERLARAQRQCFNAKIQGSAADILKLFALEALPYAWDLGARLAAAVHDELLFLCPEETADELATFLTGVFTRHDILPGVPVLGTAKIGNNWLEVH